MVNLIHVDVVDAESRIFMGEAEFVIVSAFDGEMGIFPYHIPIISKLKPGILRLKLPNEEEHKIFALSGGFLEVCDNKVLIIADIIERTDELDEERLIKQREYAYERLKHSNSSSTVELAQVQTSLEITIAQLAALSYMKKKGINPIR